MATQLAAHETASTQSIPVSPLAAASHGLDRCVHCGFCLQSCPTYLALDDENDSPRGRLLLMRSVVEGDLEPTDAAFQTHIDQCLGCRACETVCPSGVPYGELLEASRATIMADRPPSFVTRLLLGVMARPLLRRAFFAVSRAVRSLGISRLLTRMPGRAGFASAMLESTRRALPEARVPRPTHDSRGTVALLRGCVMDGLFRATNRATNRAVESNGYRVADAAGQGCCGALHAHAGDLHGARSLARRNIAAFEQSGAQWIVVNAAGCGAMMKEYAHLLSDDPVWRDRAASLSARVRDVSEVLAGAPIAAGSLTASVAYDAPCHLLHAQRVSSPPIEVLQAISALDIIPLDESDHCCGGAGIYNLVMPEISQAVLDRKLANIARTGAAFVATGNPGCIMQIGAGLLRAGSRVRVVHPIDLLDASMASANRQS